MTADEAARMALALVALATTISGLELCVIRREFRQGGILDPDVLARPGRRGLPIALVSRYLPEVTVGNGALLVVCLVGFEQPAVRIGVGALCLGISTTAYLGFRFGRDGSDDISLLSAALLSAAVAIGQPWATEAALVGIAGLAIVAYSTAGWAKLAGKSWRNGTALGAVLSSMSYGSPRFASLATRYGTLSRFAGYAVIAVESSVPIAVILGGRMLDAWLALLLLFHIGVAATMGLNRFAFAFVATYPPILWLSQQLAHP